MIWVYLFKEQIAFLLLPYFHHLWNVSMFLLNNELLNNLLLLLKCMTCGDVSVLVFSFIQELCLCVYIFY